MLSFLLFVFYCLLNVEVMKHLYDFFFIFNSKLCIDGVCYSFFSYFYFIFIITLGSHYVLFVFQGILK